MKGFYFLILFIPFFNLKSQVNPLIKDGSISEIEKKLYFGKDLKFTAFRNSFFNIEEIEKNDTALIRLLKSKNDQDKGLNVYLNPAVNVNLGVQNKDQKFVNTIGIGLSLFGRGVNDKLVFGITGIKFNSKLMNYQNEFVSQNKVVPGMNVKRGTDRVSSNYFSSFLNYKANKYFDFEIGYGRQFIGDGYRSLLLSDFANASPYFKMTTKFWKIRYTNLFASHQNIFNVEGKPSLYERKYTATHFLDWKVTKWLSFGLFETIVWQANEGVYKRGVDPNYLNPFIFYRPVEFSVGSSDNALVGTNIKFTLPQKNVLYFQTVLDEFLLAEMKADLNQFRNPDEDIRSGWWANKYGFQFGWRKMDWFNLDGLESRVEFNIVRPFTYAHSAPTQSYSNYNQSLAHPLGANFKEVLLITTLTRKKYLFRVHLNYSEKGYSEFGENLGDNIQVSNVSRTNEYENTITQGFLEKVFYSQGSISYLIQPVWNTRLGFGVIYRNSAVNERKETNSMLYISLKTNLFNSNFDY